uniref:Uncharacterized protein n=1 Tax=Glossina pallidipes TaxID=7398 RepID=A0A1A9ZM54_GLOPL
MCIVITLENGLNDNNIIYLNTRSQKELAEPAPIPELAPVPVPVQVPLHLQSINACMHSLEGLCVCLMLAAVAAAAAAPAPAPAPTAAEAIVMVVVVGVVVVSLMPWTNDLEIGSFGFFVAV